MLLYSAGCRCGNPTGCGGLSRLRRGGYDAIRRPAEPEGALQDASPKCFLKAFQTFDWRGHAAGRNPNANRADMTSG